MELKYRFTEQDYIDFVLRAVRKRNRKILITATAFLIALFAIISIVSKAQVRMIVFDTAILLAFVLIVPFMQKCIIKQQVKSKIRKLGGDFFTSDKSIALDNENLILSSSLATSKISYKNIEKVYQDDKFAYIKINGGNKTFIPLTTPGLSPFLKALQNKLSEW